MCQHECGNTDMCVSSGLVEKLARPKIAAYADAIFLIGYSCHGLIPEGVQTGQKSLSRRFSMVKGHSAGNVDSGIFFS